MNLTPLISVIIPVYNVESFVYEAINSICNQTYKNLEIIVVDDCSTDKTYEIVEGLRELDERIKLFRNQRNIKIAETLNFALVHASGEYIARMDGDDISIPNRIEILYNFLINNPDIDLIGSQTDTINEKGDFIGQSKFPSKEHSVYKGLKYRMSTVAHIWLARRKVYNVVGNYRISSVEDYDFLLRMRTLGLRFTNVEEYLYQVRIREGNTISTQGLRQRLASDFVYKLYKERLKFGYEKTDYRDTIKIISPNYIRNYFYNLSNNFLAKAVKSRKKPILFVFFSSLALLLSPIQQTKFFFFRFKFNYLL